MAWGRGIRTVLRNQHGPWACSALPNEDTQVLLVSFHAGACGPQGWSLLVPLVLVSRVGPGLAHRSPRKTRRRQRKPLIPRHLLLNKGDGEERWPLAPASHMHVSMGLPPWECRAEESLTSAALPAEAMPGSRLRVAEGPALRPSGSSGRPGRTKAQGFRRSHQPPDW